MTDNAGTTLRAARRRYFEENGFGASGGYEDRWVKVKLGPLTARFPNTAGRVRAVRYHDLHHVLTGYSTHLVGEAEIGAWEIASGCRGFIAAWVLNLLAMTLGLTLDAPAIFRAYLRGRRTRNLYDVRFDEALLDERVEAMRARLGLGAGEAEAGLRDRLTFAGWCGLGAVLLLTVVTALIAPFVGALLLVR